MEDMYFSGRAERIRVAKRSRNEVLRRAGGAAAIALLAAIMAGILALFAAVVPCGSLDPAASSFGRVRIIDATAAPNRQVMAL